MIQMILGSIVPSLFKMGDKLIEDKDKRNEYAFKVMEMSNDLALKLLDTKTYPWIDGLVKVAYASEAIVKGLLRPLGSLALAGFAAYCDINSIELSGAVETLLYGSPLAWGYSRHQEKRKATNSDW